MSLPLLGWKTKVRWRGPGLILSIKWHVTYRIFVRTKKCTMQRPTGLLVKCTKRFVVFIDNDAPFIHEHYPLKAIAREIDGGQFPGMSRYDDWPTRGLYEGLGGYLDSASIASVSAWEDEWDPLLLCNYHKSTSIQESQWFHTKQRTTQKSKQVETTRV